MSIKELKKISEEMKEIAMRRYVWKVIADKYNYYLKEVLQICKKDKVQPILSDMDEKTLLKNNIAHLKYQNLFFE